MRAIYKKELRTYLTSMTGYIFMAVLLALAGLYYAANCLLGGYPVFGVVLSSLMFLFLILAPILTMRSISEEKKQKTDQMLLTSPVAIWKIVLGKYLAMLTIFLIPMAIICLFPLVLLQFGTVSLPMAYTAIVGYILYGAACLAVGLFISGITESQVISAVLTFGALFLFYMASGIGSLFSSEGIVSEVLSALCFYERFTNFVQGIFDMTGVIYYLSVAVLFLFLTIQLLHKKHGTYRISMVAMACVMAVVVNLIAGELPSSWLKYDVSQQKLFTTGEQTAEIVSALDEDITLYLLAQEGGEDATLLELLERYEGLSSHIKVETKDPVVYPNFASQYTSEEVYENSIVVVGENRAKYINYYDIYQYSYDYYSYSSSLDAFDGEGQITSAIAYVTTDELPVLYTLEGHDEAALSTSMTASIGKENMEIESLNLLTAEAVPEDAQVLLINAPYADLSAAEEERISSYLQAGGQVIVVSGYSDVEMPNLNALLAEYGLERAQGLLIEAHNDYYLPNYPYYLLPYINSSEMTSDVANRYVLMPYAQGITQTAEVKDTLSIESLLVTSGQAYAKQDINSSTLDMEEDDILGAFDVGVAVTDSETGGRLLYFSSDLFLDEQADAMVSGGNSALFLNVLSTVSGHESTVSIGAKDLSVEYLTVTAGSAIFWGVLLAVILPLAILVTGGVIWYRRRKR